MSEPQVAPYGSWKSPITSELIVSETTKLGEIALDGEDVYWSETRPTEQGRTVIVRWTPDGKTADVTPPSFNVRTRVHEYGGGAFAISDGTIYFANFDDQRLYRQEPHLEPQAMTPLGEKRYADFAVDKVRNRLICIQEDHGRGGHDPINALVILGLSGDEEEQLLVSGNDFYSSPRISPDGSRLAWITWNHPNLPWDGSELWVSELAEDGTIGKTRQVAGGENESIFQPEWSPDGILYFISDRTGWWNLYRYYQESVEPVCVMKAEFGRPQWVFNMSTYAFDSAERIVCSYSRDGTWQLATLDCSTGELVDVQTLYSEVWNVRGTKGKVTFCAGSPTQPSSVVRLDLSDRRPHILRRSTLLEIDASYLSIPEAIEFPTERGNTAHAFYYPPKNRDYQPPAGVRPPLLVKSHGGPTGATSTTLAWEIQYWTSRGIAVLDVNYGGSTGYGRVYRERLNGLWGVVDVEDCVNGAQYLVQQGRVDGNRLAIRGGSAGGYTTLCALTFYDVFKAGASYYGISDLEALARETHKFEARYLDRLIGPYPQRRDIYEKRSPIHFPHRLSCPLILFQGLEDEVVPPNQAEMMVEALEAKGLPVAYVPFEGEQHGFRRAQTIKRTLDAELYFYSRVFGFELAEPVEPVEIRNL